ncbi:hypothetical protein [Sinomonas sp. P10A9]|uniref:Uncharacterized protein n=1 Tax=Sinomonas puerhi TaxID=3238584 RepID=A0AB39KZY8_9MICC
MEMAHSAPTAPLHVSAAPLSLPAPDGPATRPVKALPVWVRLRFPDGSERTEKGFAKAWTRDHVLVQYVGHQGYHPAAMELWTEARWVRRRTIEPQWLGRA